jgi:hypothetical protein
MCQKNNTLKDILKLSFALKNVTHFEIQWEKCNILKKGKRSKIPAKYFY